MDQGELLELARGAIDDAYAPYSEYRVGAALLTAGGEVFTGSNIEIANYSNTIHAEEAAFAKALTGGHREFEALAVSTAARDGATPCGMCRQTIAEFCGDGFPVIVDGDDGPTVFTIGDLFPTGFSKDLVVDS